jgi:translation initiation factor RLI1
VRLQDRVCYLEALLTISFFKQCPKKCPFEAITIIKLPTNLEAETTHRYSANSFKLHRLPTPRAGQVLGLVGTNGIGKSTALKILAGKQKPNLGRYDVSHSLLSVLGSSSLTFFSRRTHPTGKRFCATSEALSCRTSSPRC